MSRNGVGRDRWTSIAITAWAIVGVLLLVAAALWLLGKVASALVPFLFAVVIVYLFRTPVARLEARGVKRGLAVTICYLTGFGGLAILAVFVVPALYEQISQFITDFPRYYDSAYTVWLDMQRQYQAVQIPAWVDRAIVDLRDTIAAQTVAWSSAAAKQIFQVGSSAVTLLFNGFIATVIAFWLLKDLPEISRELTLLGGPERQHEASVVGRKVSQVLSGYLRGQLVVSLSTAVIVSIGLAILGVPYALVLGLLAGVLNIIPYIGPLIAEVTAAIVAVFVSPWLALGAVVVIIAAQQVTDLFVTPRVMSEQVDLHPVLVIFSLLAGGTLFGFTGLLLAIPVAAIAKGLFVHYFEQLTDSTLTTEGGALFRQRKAECDSEDADPESVCDETTETEETT
jgi:predicted PurR-regulated permease PerM